MKKMVISAIGQDKPGIVAAFTKMLYENHCNVEDTSMTLLEDHFTMLIIITAPADVSKQDLENKLKCVSQDFQLQLAIYTIDTAQESLEAKGRPWMMSVSGADQTGIMYHVTQYLAGHSINIRHSSSKRLSRPTGETLFLMALEVDVPEQITDDRLEEELAELGRREGLEIHAEPLEVYTL